MDVLKLSNLAKDLFHFIEKFGNLHGVNDFVLIYMLEDPVQNIESDNCGPFHLYFLENLFGVGTESEIFELKKLTKNSNEVVLIGILLLNIENNEKIAKDYNKKKRIKFGLTIC